MAYSHNMDLNIELLVSKINTQISEVTEENITEIIQNTQRLIDALNHYNKKENSSLINLAYRTIYSVILLEEIFDRSDILTYINYFSIPTNKENIARLLAMDLKALNESEELDYDYLNSTNVRKVSKIILFEKYFEYQKNKLTTSLRNIKRLISRLYLKRTLLTIKALSIIMIPIIAFTAGRANGKNTSSKFIEYKTITRTINLNTGEIVGDATSVYDENETTYVATILECSPWQENPTGIGYIRNVTAYEYITTDDISYDYPTTTENLTKKYTYVEPKNSLNEEDSTLEPSIFLIETYQDKNDNPQSDKYVMTSAILGGIIGIATDVVLALLGVYDIKKIRQMFEELNSDIKKSQLNIQEIKARLEKMKDDALQLQAQCSDNQENQLILSEINTYDLQQAVIKRSRNNNHQQ